ARARRSRKRSRPKAYRFPCCTLDFPTLSSSTAIRSYSLRIAVSIPRASFARSASACRKRGAAPERPRRHDEENGHPGRVVLHPRRARAEGVLSRRHAEGAEGGGPGALVAAAPQDMEGLAPVRH